MGLETQVKLGAATLGWRIKDGRIGPVVSFGWAKASVPLAGSRAQMVDQTGKRVTITRLATVGLFAFAAKKKTGTAKVMIVSPEGTLNGSTKHADKAWEFCLAYNQMVGVDEAVA